jgi:hypothetical protein
MLRTESPEVNQDEMADPGLRGQLSNRRGVAMTGLSGEFWLVIRHAAIMKQYVNPPD